MKNNRIDIAKDSILGLHYSGMHDSSVSIMDSKGNIVFASSLERFTRIKGDGRFPYKILDFISLENISTIAITNNETYQIAKDSSSKIHSIKLEESCAYDRSHEKIWKKQIESYFFTKKIQYNNHHLCHASSSFYCSEFDESLCLVYDGGMSNEHWFGGVYFANKKDGIKELDLFSSQEYSNITFLYLTITALLGFTPLKHEGKITGLAALGKINTKCKDIFNKWLLNPSKYIGPIVKWTNMYETDKIPTLKVNPIQKDILLEDLKEFKKEDIAATLQYITEEHIWQILTNIKKLNIKTKNICLSGGLFANVKVNQRIFEFGFDNIFISPPMGDDGTSLGAAILALKNKNIQFKNVYFGYKENKNIEEFLKKKNIKYINPQNKEEFLAQQLADGKICAIYQDRAEFGPRALGNRTILAPVTQDSINDGLNKKLSRTEFMPFAPVVRDIDVDKYFKLKDGEKNTARFMTITCNCTKLANEDCPAVVHVDNTARPQIVSQDDNEIIYNILTNYSNMTNIFALVNTSFNIHEEPIVNDYTDAIKGFFEAGLDYLYIDGLIISLQDNIDIHIDYLRQKIYKLESDKKSLQKESLHNGAYYNQEQNKNKELESKVNDLNSLLNQEQNKNKELNSKVNIIKDKLSLIGE